MANMMPIGNKFFKNSSVEKDMKQVEIDKSNKIIFIHLNFSPIILIKENEKMKVKTIEIQIRQHFVRYMDFLLCILLLYQKMIYVEYEL